MTWFDNTVLCVIPCRIGSKGIHRKNLQLVNGVSLIERAVRFAEELTFVDRIVVSTDSDEVADLYYDYAHITPSGHLHSDTCTAWEVWTDAWNHYPKMNQSIYLEPTSPIRLLSDVMDCLKFLNHHSSVCTVSETQKRFCPEKQIIEGEIVKFLIAERVKQRQDISKYYHLNGVCYAAGARHYVESAEMFFSDCKQLETEHVTVNIDDPCDLEIAGFFLKLREICNS